MPNPPPCKQLGRHCRELDVTVRISDLEDDGKTLQDAAATWLTGHTERITWGEPYVAEGILKVDATVHVPCRYLENSSDSARCQAYGYNGREPQSTQPADRATLQFGQNKFSIIHHRLRRTMDLPFEEPPPRSLPVLQSENPCATAECRTADNKRGAACCRDLTLELDLPERKKRLEALIRSRKNPYVCRVKRDDEDTLDCEVISSCGYLENGSVNCTLHGRVRPNGRPAKPSICSEWPDELDEDETGHPGCVLLDEDDD
jgi:hypothetical protein